MALDLVNAETSIPVFGGLFYFLHEEVFFYFPQLLIVFRDTPKPRAKHNSFTT